MPRLQPQLSFSRQTGWRDEGEGATVPRQQQRRSVAPASSDSGSNSPRRVTFAVQNVPPSPVVYHAHSRSSADRELQTSQLESLPGNSGAGLHGAQARASTGQPQPRTHSEQHVSVERSAPQRAAVPEPRRTRRPRWNADVTQDSALFDGSLKKSLLFRPRAGDRRKEQREGTQQMPSPEEGGGAAVKRAQPRRKKPTAAAAATPTRYRSGPSSIYAQYRQQSTSHRPRRRSKDYVKQNIEKLTGRPVEGRTTSTKGRVVGRESVFDRLTSPRVNKALLHHHASLETLEAPEKGSISSSKPFPVSPARSSSSRPSPSSSSPVLTIEPPAPEHHDASFATPYSPSVPELNSQFSSRNSSPQRSQRSHSSRRPSGQHSTSSSRRSNGSEPRSHRKKSFPAQVFAVLDRNGSKRVGVDQVLQGLRLLGLPATHNQIADYVYLIHEGRRNTVDLEEWEILVGTLDAASRPPVNSPRNANVDQGSYASPFAARSPSSRSIYEHPEPRYPHSGPRVGMDSAGDNPPSSIPTEDVVALEQEDPCVINSIHRQTCASAAHQPIPDDDPYLEEIQNHIEAMFQRAEATVALRQIPETGTNQNEDDLIHSRSNRVLKRAATVVYSLKTSLFPLVHQAEATLREIQQRHGSKLSLFLPPADLSAIAQNSDALASSILDDVLLDTVQLLNDEDRRRSHCQMEKHHADQLDTILARIQQIEQEEKSMIEQGLSLGYSTPEVRCELPLVAPSQQTSTMCATTANGGSTQRENLILPLEVVMNISVPDEDPRPLSRLETLGSGENVAKNYAPHEQVVENVKDLQLPFDLKPTAAIGSVATTILQGPRLQSIEKRRSKFLRHRKLVEASLAETGMAQCVVIEMLEDMMLDDLVEEAAAELDDTVSSLSDALLTSLL